MSIFEVKVPQLSESVAEATLLQWKKKAGNDETFTFLCELGPPEYAMTGPDGYELSDRWQESLLMKDQIRALWQSL